MKSLYILFSGLMSSPADYDSPFVALLPLSAVVNLSIVDFSVGRDHHFEGVLKVPISVGSAKKNR